MNARDRLDLLLPAIYRQRDVERGEPLRALLQVIAEQADLLDQGITQLYENWFIETCQDWVVPYIGDLIGYQPIHEAGEAADVRDPEGRLRNRILIPRREVANTLRYRRRKGTLALLELLANDVAGWPGRAVEFYRLLFVAQHINHVHLERGSTVDLRSSTALELLDGPFDRLAHNVDVRRPTSHRTLGRYNIPSVGLFVWRLKAYSITDAPAYCFEEEGPHCFLFSVLGNDTPLFTPGAADPAARHGLGELGVPGPIRRRALQARPGDYYGPGQSFAITLGPARTPVSLEQIVAADLSGWHYHPPAGYVAVDPQLGRIVFPPRQPPEEGVEVSYYYGFSADMAGGEYDRPARRVAGYRVYRVGEGAAFQHIGDALLQWMSDAAQSPHAIIEIIDSAAYTEQLEVTLKADQRLEIRAADGHRPVLRVLDFRTAQPDALTVKGEAGSRFIIDGLLITGRGVEVRGAVSCVTIRHSTLVPGWGLGCDCEPDRPTEPSLTLFNFRGRLDIEHSILGSIEVNEDEVRTDPVPIQMSDSILDATAEQLGALEAPGAPVAHAVLTMQRCTVIGFVQAHAIELAENSLFVGRVTVARRQRGCMRFCYVPDGSRTPRRYHCQPDLVEQAVAEQLEAEAKPGVPDPLVLAATEAREAERVRPQVNSTRYGRPTYCQLAEQCAEEIVRGADDESEMGAFHDLFQPQRDANLQARVSQYTPAGTDAAVIHAS
ncbi:MAG TPA: hypothetical protein VIV88_00580 [Gemmatimonadales bacterium]|jgi:hypothetical protein